MDKGRAVDRERAIERTLWILGVPSSPSDYRGLAAERKALQALKYHQKKKTEFPGGRVIQEVTPTLHFSQADMEGKDAYVKFQNGETLAIQIQNWWSRRVEREFRKKGICLIAIWPNEEKGTARKRAFEAIFRFYQS